MRFLICLLLFSLLGSSTACQLENSPLPSTKISPKLLETLSQAKRVNIMVSLKEETGPVIQKLSKSFVFNGNSSTLNDQRSLIYESLLEHTERTQKPVLKFLEEYHDSSLKVQSFWITNKIAVEGATKILVEALAEFDEVSDVHEEQKIQINQDYFKERSGELYIEGGLDRVEWGVDIIRASQVWSDLGVEGEGIVVGMIDSGVRMSHEAMKDSYVGDKGWFDASGLSTEPFDDFGHGTHVMGTILGRKGVGVAPKARWMTCRADFGQIGGAPESELYTCGQFIACPTDDPKGDNKDCSKAPRVVNNSWGSNATDELLNFYADVILCWRAFNIIPVFAHGNYDYAQCGYSVRPAENPMVIGVGATTQCDALAHFSMLGPSSFGEIKPNIVAPGDGVYSSGPDSDTHYVKGRGTSMAAPHVTGVIALMLSANPDLKYIQAKSILEKTAEKNLYFSRRVCADLSDDVFPNNFFGHGRVDAFKAVQMAKEYAKSIN